MWASSRCLSSASVRGGAVNSIDFYINGNKRWLIEITRKFSLHTHSLVFILNLHNIGEGDKFPEHVARFQPPNGQQYCKIPCKGSVILDFRRIQPLPSTVEEYDLMWFVVYDETYAGATIVRKGHPDLKIEFTAPPLTKAELRQREDARIKAMLEEPMSQYGTVHIARRAPVTRPRQHPGCFGGSRIGF
jgi:hypothetical protein